jgi:hypothetical protein
MQRAAFLLPSFIVIAGMLVAARAEAQSLEVSKEIHRQQPPRPDSQRPRWVNRADCLARDVYTFSVSLRDYDDYTLQVWAGDRGIDCKEKENRGTGDSECWLVFAAEADAPTMSVEVSAVDLVARESPTKSAAEARVVHGSTDVCTDSSASKGVPLGLHFMLVDSAGAVGGDPRILTDIGYDVVPPAAPSKVTTSAGETRIFVDWKPPRASDVRSYVFYCDSDTTAVKEPRRVTPLRPASVDAAGGDAAIDDTGADTKDENTSDESDDGGTAGECAPWSVLLPGTDPESPHSLAPYVCGSAGGDDHSTVIDHLKNDVTYVVAVAASDDTGNVSVLSSQACETPVDLTDFFELYRRAGGKAGGGLCSISRPESAPDDGSRLAAAVFALAVAAKRRTSRRR